MDLVNNYYGSSDEEDRDASNVQNTSTKQKSLVAINATPDTGFDVWDFLFSSFFLFFISLHTQCD